ncbi:MAG: FAD-binding oxidoreductase [Nitrosopumilus sp.]|nr:FAD-binding oxidoreductase [Nitrosopumilus sp.]MDH3515908.1 FAD-binding oxidoreductase [Nitrosopumilus sp.]MDH3564832.1 FAD-binding oxidoreductase [Nitrosopumilus sp.]MDH5417234.1 FAD-binding oxidoreductase [Nitrosopumilus sp.]MDH5554636.1 FAD-binding oxidoreductase [Nitrosopumilus sp.]
MKKIVLKILKSKIQGDVFSSKEFKEFYSVDASSYKIIPNVVVIPKHEKDVINVIKIAKKFKIPVTARGAGTGLVGSALNRGIILDMKKFDSIKISKNYALVGTGVIKGQLDKRLEKVKKFFPPNPSIGSFCSVGGMLGNNSSGSRSLKYGSVIDNVIEITFVDGNARKITLPENKNISNKIIEFTKLIDSKKFPKTSKNSSGYRIDKVKSIGDTHKLIIGSEGTLGVILSAKIKIKDIAKRRILFVLGYCSIADASRECMKINQTNPSTIEFMDKFILDQIKFKFVKNTKCLLYVEYDENILVKERKLQSVITGKIVKKLKKEYEIEQWWRYRDLSLHYSLKTIKKGKRIPHVIEDAAVPLNNLPKVFSLLNKINKKYKTVSIVYGHAGNGNMHVRLISDGIKIKIIKNIAKEYFNEIIKLDGTITGEHGDGLARSEFVKKQYGRKNYGIFKEMKKLFDPNNILNPGKIISKKSTVINNLEIF